jgi:ankyrin repeat protein
VAAASGHAEIVEILLREGANVEATNRDGNTALILAERSGYADIVELLLARAVTTMLR